MSLKICPFGSTLEPGDHALQECNGIDKCLNRAKHFANSKTRQEYVFGQKHKTIKKENNYTLSFVTPYSNNYNQIVMII